MQRSCRTRAKTLRIKLKTPLEKLPREAREKLLSGGDDFADCWRFCRRFIDDASDDYREWLTEYMSPVAVPGVRRQAAAARQPGGAGEEHFRSRSSRRCRFRARC